MNFKKVELADAELLMPFLTDTDELTCEISFINLLLWEPLYNNCYCIENGILYLIKLNTQYDEAAGTLSINPSRVVKWRYSGSKSNTTAVDGSNGWWLGIEDSAIVWRNVGTGGLFCNDGT